MTVLVAVYRPYPTKESEWQKGMVEGGMAKGKREDSVERVEREGRRVRTKKKRKEKKEKIRFSERERRRERGVRG